MCELAGDPGAPGRGFDDVPNHPSGSSSYVKDYLRRLKVPHLEAAYAQNLEQAAQWNWKKHGSAHEKEEAEELSCGMEKGGAADRTSAHAGAQADFDPSNTIHMPSLQEARAAVQEADVLVAMHPDQAAEWVVDCALDLGKPFFVVPCCTHGKEFAFRRQQNGQPVNTYEHLLDWLQAKHPDIRRSSLEFGGKSTVLWRT